MPLKTALTVRMSRSDRQTSTVCCFEQTWIALYRNRIINKHTSRCKMNSVNASKICRICCNQTSIDLISLLNEENKTIVKKLRACADITVSIWTSGAGFLWSNTVFIDFVLHRSNMMTCYQSTFAKNAFKTSTQRTALRFNANIWIKNFVTQSPAASKSIPIWTAKQKLAMITQATMNTFLMSILPVALNWIQGKLRWTMLKHWLKKSSRNQIHRWITISTY